MDNDFENPIVYLPEKASWSVAELADRTPNIWIRIYVSILALGFVGILAASCFISVSASTRVYGTVVQLEDGIGVEIFEPVKSWRKGDRVRVQVRDREHKDSVLDGEVFSVERQLVRVFSAKDSLVIGREARVSLLAESQPLLTVLYSSLFRSADSDSP